MKITLIAFGQKMPSWVTEATKEYSKRLQEFCDLNLIELPLQKRGKAANLNRIQEKELASLKAVIPSNALLIALAIEGKTFSSEQLAQKLEQLQHRNSHWCFLIGGPEGLPTELIQQCQERWSLSSLTLPHPLARVVFLEAMYRAWSIVNHHPYHK